MAASIKTYKAGQMLFAEGDAPTAIYIVRKGAVSIRKIKDNTFLEIGKIQSGEVIGELSFFDRQPRSATAVALIEVEVNEIPFDALEKIYNSIPDYMKTIMAALADRLRKANDQLRILQKSQAKAMPQQ